MVSQEHVQRLATLIESTAGTVVYGGAYDVDERYVQPTIIKDVAANDALMQEEACLRGAAFAFAACILVDMWAPYSDYRDNGKVAAAYTPTLILTHRFLAPSFRYLR